MDDENVEMATLLTFFIVVLNWKHGNGMLEKGGKETKI
jgi:hypothetical protein